MDNLDFLSGREKLVGGIPPFSMEDWPKVRSSILWERIESQYGLSLPELCAVKNVVCIGKF